MADTPALTEFTEEERLEALERFQVIRPFLEEGIPLTDLSRHHGVPLRTARRWVQKYRQDGLPGLVRKPRSDLGGRKMPLEMQHLIEGLALRRPPPTASFVHRKVVILAVEHGWPKPSYAVVYDIISKLDPGLIALAHEGTKEYKEAFDLVHRREASQPNEIWQADHSVLDVWLVDDKGKPARPWLTIIMDDYSRAVAGYFLTFQAPSVLNTSLALRQAIWRKEVPGWHVCGIPENFYTDHGSDFTSKHMEQVSADIRMTLVFSTPGIPRGRGRIERFFQTVNQLFLCELPGYTPAGTKPAKPELTLSQLDSKIKRWLLEEYHLRDHGGTGIPPQARWEAGGFLPRLPDSLAELDLLLMTVTKARKIMRDGIHFEGLRYVDPTLAAYIGETVTIRYDPRDLAEIRVYHENKFLCRAVCQELSGHQFSLKEITHARNQRRHELRKDLKERTAIVDRLIAAHQPESPLPQLVAASDPPQDSVPQKPRLRRYHHDE